MLRRLLDNLRHGRTPDPQARDREIIRRALSREPLARVAERLWAAVLPSIRLVRRSDGGRAAGRSRLGGEPDLAPEVAWPEWQGRPLGFLAQVDLAEVPRPEPGGDLLPPEGLLSLFFDVDPERQPWGYDPAHRGGGRVLWSPASAELERRRVPDGLPDELRPREHALDFAVELTLPDSWSWPGERLDLSPEEDEAYFDLGEAVIEAHGGDEPQHRLLGHPDQIQNDMQLECQLVTHGLNVGDSDGYQDPRAAELVPGAVDWRLLAQIDSDDAARLEWGDLGRVYFWIREQDLRARRFDAAWVVLQSS